MSKLQKQTRASIHQGFCSLSGRAYYRKKSWSIEAARLDVLMIISLWNLTGISAALLPRSLSNFRAERLEKFKPESRGFETSRDVVLPYSTDVVDFFPKPRASWRLESPETWLFVQQLALANNTEPPHYWTFVMESNSNRWIPLTKGH